MNKFSIDRDGSIAAFVRNFLGVMGICQQACVTWDAPIFELFLEKFQLSGVSTFWDLLSIWPQIVQHKVEHNGVSIQIKKCVFTGE